MSVTYTDPALLTGAARAGTATFGPAPHSAPGIVLPDSRRAREVTP